MKKKETPIPILRREVEASQLLHIKTSVDAPPIAIIEVPSREQSHISLGNFSTNVTPKGFALEVTPEEMEDAIVPQLTRLSADYSEYEFVLHIANYGDRTINVEVSEL
jgi:hypothetical protein